MLSDNKNKCLICDAPEYQIIFSYDRPDQYEKVVGVRREGYFRKWVQCRNCGLYYSIYSRDNNLIDKIYASAYRDKCSAWRTASNEAVFESVMALPDGNSETKYRVRWIKQQIQKLRECGMVEFGASPYRMLDIGGGTGVFSYEFQDSDWKSHVIDPDENAQFIESKLNIPLVQKKYESNSFPWTFYLISAIFVLEHLVQPDDFLKSLHHDMNPHSLLYIEVPDALCFKRKSREDDIYNACHLWMFTPQTILALLDRCGFDVFRLCRTKTLRGHYSLMILGGSKWK